MKLGKDPLFGLLNDDDTIAVIAGDHNTSVLGEPMRYVEAKRPGDDMPVTIEDEVWIGYGVVTLKGVKIGRGSIVLREPSLRATCRPIASLAGYLHGFLAGASVALISSFTRLVCMGAC